MPRALLATVALSGVLSGALDPLALAGVPAAEGVAGKKSGFAGDDGAACPVVPSSISASSSDVGKSIGGGEDIMQEMIVQDKAVIRRVASRKFYFRAGISGIIPNKAFIPTCNEADPWYFRPARTSKREP